MYGRMLKIFMLIIYQQCWKFFMCLIFLEQGYSQNYLTSNISRFTVFCSSSYNYTRVFSYLTHIAIVEVVAICMVEHSYLLKIFMSIIYQQCWKFFMCLIFVGQRYPRKLFNLEHFLIYGMTSAIDKLNGHGLSNTWAMPKCY